MAKTVTFKNEFDNVTFKNEWKAVTFKNSFASVIFDVIQEIAGIFDSTFDSTFN